MKPSFSDWSNVPISDLCRHIVERYHTRIREDLPRIESLLRETSRQMGDEGAYLDVLLRGWRALAIELRAHLEREEAALFPMLSRLESSGDGDAETADALVSGLGREHDDAALALLSMARLTKGFAPPENASPLLRELYESLERFDAEFREHVGLENGVLLPRARRLASRRE